MLPFHQAVAADFEQLNQQIVDELHSDVSLVENIGQYIVEGGGKRLRPVSVLLANRALDGNNATAIKMACIIEFIHTATLLHDDVVDDSSRRRGRDTANEIWGNAPAVLVGDFIYSRAFQLMVRIGNPAIMALMADTTNLIAEGEVQQLLNAGNPEVTEQDYMQVVRKKTAVLFSAATESAAILAGASASVQQDLASYGLALGMAFQIQDDLLDYLGDADALGKNLGDDLAEGKPTLPLIYLLQNGSAEQKALISQALSGKDASMIEQVAAAVKSSAALDYTRQCAQQQVELSMSALASLPAGEFRDLLESLARFALDREF